MDETASSPAEPGGPGKGSDRPGDPKAPEDRWNLRSDGEPGVDGHLGCFRREPAVFTVYQVSPVPHRYTPGPAEYLVDVDDGAGPRECCRFTDDPEDVPEWNGRWNGDEWCGWILRQARARIAEPDDR